MLESLAKSLRLAAALVLVLAAGAAAALDKPNGDVILTISGKLASPNAGQKAQFDMAMLEKLPQHSFTTQTPWHSGPTKFTGPLLRDVLAAAGANGNKLVAVALNDYKTDIPFSDAGRYDVIVARLLNDKPMPVREKGPLFIIYPFDSKAELKAETFYNRSAWQLNQLQVQ
ncbi:molybdopterin-dependent oxidoreductase [Pseudorhodoferax sp.]|uniref:molybdopterin-dependent oxidoreductase n=1 Tax=Pseudorhodoferax sp. TaxID=1993553 RepID=UPI002DD63BF3|nr:molybdopterin-dependent oxidoreductase [Pseudorhodoferax sp.]